MATVAASDRAAVSERRGNRPDSILLSTMILMSGLGLLMIFSVTRYALAREGALESFSMERQMIFVVAGMICVFLFSVIDYREYRNYLPLIYGASVLLLLPVFLFDEINGARRWIDLRFFNLQPSEFVKVVLILTTAYILAANREDLPLRWKYLLRSGALVAIPSGIILLQPDLGTTLVLPFVWIVMLFAAGMTWKQGATLGIIGTSAVAMILRFDMLSEYQLNRIRVFMDDAIDPQGIGYNLRQSKLAIGSGQLLGRGLFEGTQTNFSYVPEQETDFIFTAIGEQLGFIGGLLVIVGFLVITWRLIVIAATARDRFGSLIAVGIAGLVSFHVFVNIGMTIGIAPVTGLPLPFLSQGGSFFLSMSICVGIANSIWLRRSPVPGERYRA